MVSCVMNTINKRKVITVDMPGVFLKEVGPQDKHPGYIMFKRTKVDIEEYLIPSTYQSSKWDVTWCNYHTSYFNI